MIGRQVRVQPAAGPKEQDLLRAFYPDLLQNARCGGTADGGLEQAQRLPLIGKAVDGDDHAGVDGTDDLHRKPPLQRLHHLPLECHQYGFGEPLYRLGKVGGFQQLLAAVKAVADHW